jgi:hypothetical protein
MINDKSLIEREKEALAIALQQLLKDMDVDNRSAVAKKLKVSEKTVYRYLNGDVADKSLGSKIQDACRKNILEREQKLEQHKNAA